MVIRNQDDSQTDIKYYRPLKTRLNLKIKVAKNALRSMLYLCIVCAHIHLYIFYLLQFLLFIFAFRHSLNLYFKIYYFTFLFIPIDF